MVPTTTIDERVKAVNREAIAPNHRGQDSQRGDEA